MNVFICICYAFFILRINGEDEEMEFRKILEIINNGHHIDEKLKYGCPEVLEYFYSLPIEERDVGVMGKDCIHEISNSLDALFRYNDSLSQKND
ncbi:unnamed protein product [Caenorhabditis angaria]|uniref:Uncharacterized protein n=1 Tax=Caenorhabditis angaria TaxID=860376 RepID=A0A9P1J2T4_9PELO|nr:unnamed protein product [Caenorhabditis angaria]